MRFGILGPLSVLDGGRDLTPRRAKQRALLAVLLLHPNAVVSADQLIDALWGEAPPATAANALHGHVAALRRLLGARRIETRAPGYRLWVEPGELDAAHFESLVDEARRHTDPGEQSRRLREALALWRGDALVELRFASFAQGEAIRLAELRAGALEDRLDADLAQGRHHELIPELEALVAGHPFRERLRCQLMLSLYRCGRQVDALQVFQSGRHALLGELGIEPGPALQELQQQILRHDRSLALEHRAGEGPPPHRPARPDLAEERKLATILFADVSGSAASGEPPDPERLRVPVRAYFATSSEIVAAWGGTFETHVGDAITAVFGVPTAHEGDAERAIRSALAMVERLEDVNRTTGQAHGIRLSVRIGVNTGEVIASRDASAGSPIVAGDAVNVAARLVQAAGPDTILAGQRTCWITRRTIGFGAQLTLDTTGTGGPLVARPVERTVPVMEPHPPALQAPFVGRGHELDQLDGLLDEAVATRSPRLAVVYGTAGIGKSRLTREFLGLARERHPDVTALKGRCLAAGRGITYWAFGEILREAFRMALDDGAETAAARLRTGARQALAGLALSGEEVDRTVFALALTAGIAMPDNPLEQLEPRAVADELGSAWPRLATALAMQRPTVLVIEDLHWAGEALLEMLGRLATRAEGPLLVLATTRPEVAETGPAFEAARRQASSLWLKPFAEHEAAELIAGLLDSAELQDELRRAIVRAGDGNPFFIEEIVLRLVDTRAVVREGNRWRAVTDAASISVPDSVRSLLAARIDALPSIEKRVLQEAAVAGRAFWRGSLALALGEAAVRDALLALEDRGLIAERPISSLRGQAEFQFKHALVRDVAYAGLPAARRAQAHAQYAWWLEELAGERLEEVVELVAHHYHAAVAGGGADLAWAADAPAFAGLRARAFETLLWAGAAARRRYAIAKALELHHQALAIAATEVERGRALAAVGDDHEANFHGDEALAAYEAALEVLRERPGTEPLRARVCLMASRMAAVKWGGFRSKPTPARMEQLVDEGLAVATDEETRHWLTVLKGTVGPRWLWARLEDPVPLAERIRLARTGVALAEQLGSPSLLSLAYRVFGLLESLAGRWDASVETARRDLRLAERLEPADQAFALMWDTLFLMEIAGEVAGSLPHAERSLELARGLTPHDLMHGTYTVMSGCFHLGRWSGLDPLADEHLDALAKEPGIGCPFARSGPLVAALACAHQGRFERAAALSATLTPDLDTPGLPEALLARCLVARGAPDAARELAGRIVGRTFYAEENAFEIVAMLEALVALEDWQALAAFLPQARSAAKALALIGPSADRAEGLARAAAGDGEAAADLLTRALVAFDRMGLVFEAALGREGLAAVLPNGDAARLRAEALSVYDRLGAAPHAERLRATSV